MAPSTPLERLRRAEQTGSTPSLPAERVALTPLARRRATLRYSDAQPRDPDGRFAGGGSSDTASKVVEAARSGGGTIHPTTGEEPKSGYAVAVPGHSSITKDSEFFGGKGEQITKDWMAKNKDVLSKPGMHVGVWHDKAHGEVVLDPSHVVADRDSAIAEGKAGDQQAIFHLDTGEEIPTGGTGGRQEAA